MYLVVQPHHLQDDPEKQYRIVDAKIVSLSELLEMHPDLSTVQMDTHDLLRMRYVILLQNHLGEPLRVRIFQWNDLNIPKFRSMPPEACAAMEGNGVWADILIHMVENMSLKEAERKLLGR